MDNNYYEYAREGRVRRNVKEEKPNGSLGGVILVQFLLSLAVTGLLFAVCRTDTSLSANLKSFYSELSKTDMSASEILGTFKRVAEFTFAPSAEWNGAASADEDISEEITNQDQGETDETGEKAVFSPVYLTPSFQNPVESDNITSRFGYRISPITNKYSLHTGLDIAAEKGAKISAVYGGTVEKTGFDKMRGNYVIIKHGENIKTTYNHCSLLLVREGMRIRKGETVALVGSTGASTGNHLHFEVLLNGKYVNPLWTVYGGI